MTEAEGGRCELVADLGVGLRVVFVMAVIAAALEAAEQIVGVLIEDDALVFGLVDDLGSLEQFFFGAFEARGQQRLDMIVVVAGPHRMDRGEGEVFVRAQVAGHIVVEDVGE